MFPPRLQLLNTVKGGGKKELHRRSCSSLRAAAGKGAKGKADVSDEGCIGRGAWAPAELGHPTAARSAATDPSRCGHLVPRS